jgi:hypothetical protein
LTFLNYSDAEVNEQGLLAFTAQLAVFGSTSPVASASDVGMWVGGSPSTLTFIAREGAAAPGASSQVFGLTSAASPFVSPPALNNAGRVVFKSFLLNPDNTFGGAGIWTGHNNADLTLIAHKGDPTPIGSTFFDFSAPDLNNNEEMSFLTTLADNRTALWFWHAGVFTQVARTGVSDPAQGGPGGGVSFVAFRGENQRVTNLNERGDVAFQASVSNGDQGIWLWSRDPQTGSGFLTQVARSGDPAPGTALSFAAAGAICTNSDTNPCFRFPVLNNKGEIAFQAKLTDGSSGIWAWDGNLLTLVAHTGVIDPAQGGPGGSSPFSVFGENLDSSPVANGQSEVLFEATLADGRKGIWAWNGGVPVLVARTGDPLTVALGDNRVISGLFLQASAGEEDGRRSGFNNAAEATFRATFTGGSGGIFIAKVFEHAPIANAGPDQSVNEMDLVTLDGSGSSDADRDALTYLWTQLAGPSVALNNSTAVHPSFTACCVPAGGATLTFKLTVSDGQTTAADTVDITVTNVNHPPVADAGPNQTVQEGSPVLLDGSFSYDPDAETLTFSWVQTAGSLVSLIDANTDHPSFTAPLVGPAGETLTFRLTVSDGIDNATDTIDVRVDNVNHQPAADAGDDQTVGEGGAVALDGALSSDPDLDGLTYTWTQVSGPSVTLSDEHSATPTFTAPMVNAGGVTLVFTLVVNDGFLNSDPDTVVITVQELNDPPACNLAQADPNWLWPPNHKLIPIAITGVTDPNDDAVTITVTNVTQDEPVKGLGDGDTSPDAVPQDNGVLLRAERAGNGNGRVYLVTFTAADDASGSCTGTVTVCVPQSSKATACVDSGQSYNSQQP